MSYTPEERATIRARAIDGMTTGDTGPVGNAMNAAAIRVYGEDARAVILAKRAEFRNKRAQWADKWKTAHSRRPMRNRHWDTWSTREHYVRGAGEYSVTVSNNPSAAGAGRWHR